MSCQVLSSILSFLFHTVVVVSIVQLGSLIPSNQNPLVIDFSIEKVTAPVSDSSKSVKASVVKSSKTSVKKKIVKKKKLTRKVRPALKKKEILKPVLPEKKEEKPLVQKESEVFLPQRAPEIIEDELIPEETIVKKNINTVIEEQPLETANRADDLTDAAVDSQEYARTQYIKEHFKYISRIVQKNISYPYIAKKMLWEGKVTISFIINVDGSVQDICIEKSSGFDILDKNAKETVKSTSPFPPPIVEAKIVIPIVYRLM